MVESNESELERRRYPRMKARVLYKPTRILGQKRQAPNISLGGMRIYSNQHFKKGQVLEIELSLPSGKLVIAKGLVVWVEAYPKDSDALYDIGLEFIHLPAEAMEELKLELDKTSLNE